MRRDKNLGSFFLPNNRGKRDCQAGWGQGPPAGWWFIPSWPHPHLMVPLCLQHLPALLYCLNSLFQCFCMAMNSEKQYTFSMQHISFHQFQINVWIEWLLLYFETSRMEVCDIFSLYHSILYAFHHEPYYYAHPKMDNLTFSFLSSQSRVFSVLWSFSSPSSEAPFKSVIILFFQMRWKLFWD